MEYPESRTSIFFMNLQCIHTYIHTLYKTHCFNVSLIERVEPLWVANLPGR